MPARAERVFICPRESGRPAWIVNFPLWWDRAGFFEKFGARRIDTGNPFYVDYGYLLTGAEALVWDRQCREAGGERATHKHVPSVEAMDQLAARLKSASWVVVESYEWESGLT